MRVPFGNIAAVPTAFYQSFHSGDAYGATVKGRDNGAR